MLDGYRVLDLTDERGQLAGSMLAALGAEVILVEPPDGSPSRRLGPWAGRAPGVERSLTHWAYNRGKASVVLDLANAEPDRARLRDLVAGADVLIESASPGYMDAIGLGYDDLAASNPGLVYVSVTPFGSDGPKAGWHATDLTVWASAMALALTGDGDRPPVRVSVPQAFAHAAADAACGALLALHERVRSGLGQHVDISAQQSSLQATQAAVLAEPLRTATPQRTAGGVRVGPLSVRMTFPCADGDVSITFLFGAAMGPATGRLMAWVCEEGHCDEATRDKNWIDYPMLLLSGQEPMSEYERVKDVVEAFTLTKTKAELLAGALARRVLVAPVNRVDELVASEQLVARDYFEQVSDDALTAEPFLAPGPFARCSATPLRPAGRAPRLGADTERVLATPRKAPDAPPGPARSGALPLEGLKVLDLMWVIAGPSATRVLADYGATVVRVESSTRIEAVRTINPFYEGVPDPERSGVFWNLNAGKLGLALNLAKPEAIEVLHDLVKWADVVTESFSPRVLRDLGMDYATLRGINPSVIMLSSCLMGQTGPLAEFAGYGNLAAAIAGFYEITGWPDRPPAGPFGAYTDYVAPRYALAALLAALDHRRRTGQGQYIDLSQAEAAIHFLAPAILDYTVNGNVQGRQGNADPNMAPHGVYAAAGEDSWVAIACAADVHWRRLAELVGRSDLAADPGLATLAGRLEQAEDLDKIVEAWTSTRPAQLVAELCQRAGVPAHAVQSSAECVADPQLVARSHFVEVEHATFGAVTIEGSRLRLTRTPARVQRAGPMIGQDTIEVLSGILGYDEDRIGDLYAAEALE